MSWARTGQRPSSHLAGSDGSCHAHLAASCEPSVFLSLHLLHCAPITAILCQTPLVRNFLIDDWRENQSCSLLPCPAILAQQPLILLQRGVCPWRSINNSGEVGGSGHLLARPTVALTGLANAEQEAAQAGARPPATAGCNLRAAGHVRQPRGGRVPCRGPPSSWATGGWSAARTEGGRGGVVWPPPPAPRSPAAGSPGTICGRPAACSQT